MEFLEENQPEENRSSNRRILPTIISPLTRDSISVEIIKPVCFGDGSELYDSLSDGVPVIDRPKFMEYSQAEYIRSGACPAVGQFILIPDSESNQSLQIHECLSDALEISL